MATNSRPKIVLLITSAFAAAGGIETFNRALLKALDDISTRRQWRAQVLSLLDDQIPPLRSLYLSSGRVEMRGFSGDRVKFALAALGECRAAESVVLGHVHFSPLALAMNGVRKYLLVYGIDVWRRVTVCQRLGISRVKRILAVSSYTARRMSRQNRVEENKFETLPMTLDPLYGGGHCAGYSRADLNLPNGRMILTVSRMDASNPYKNIDQVIRAIPAILKKIPDVFYVIVGSGNDMGRLQNLSHYAGVASRVFFAGLVPAAILPSYYASCDVFVLTSTHEGFGIVFLEAMYHGKACIGADAGGVPEVIEHERTGMLVNPQHYAEELEHVLIRLLSDESVRLTMGQRGRERLQGNFSFEKFRDTLEQNFCA